MKKLNSLLSVMAVLLACFSAPALAQDVTASDDAQSTITALKEKLSALELRNKLLENRIEEMKNSSAERLAGERKAAMADQQVKMSTLKNENATLLAQLNALTARSADPDDRRTQRDDSKRIKALGADLEEQKRALAKQKKKLADLGTENDVLEAEVVRLKADLKTAAKSRYELSSRIEDKNTAAKRAATELAMLEKELEKEREGNARLKSEIEGSAEEQDKLSAEIKALTKAAKRADKRHAKLQEQLEKEKSRASELKTDLSVAEGVMEDLTDEAKRKDQSSRRAVGQIADLETEIEALKEDLAESAATEKSLTEELATLKTDHSKLQTEMTALEKRKLDIRSSDLFRKVEEANVVFRKKLVELETQRHKAVKAMEKMKKRDQRHDDAVKKEREGRKNAEERIEETLKREGEHKELIEKLMTEIPLLENEVADLEQRNRALTEKLALRDESVMGLKAELRKREHRLDKAERVAQVLESAREEVIHVNDREKRDMHYNMAAVYVREGRFHDAETEYLRALRIDPTDADVHYNLAILYDDELKNSSKAIMHYKRYLKLNPHGSDADLVRDWLMKLDMNR